MVTDDPLADAVLLELNVLVDDVLEEIDAEAELLVEVLPISWVAVKGPKLSYRNGYI